MKKDAYIGKKGFGQVYTYLLIFVLLITACSKTEGAKDVSGETASLSVTLKGQSIESKAVAPTGEPELQALKEAENALKNVVVFVFNANGILDKKHNFSPSAVTETITGLLAGPKKVVVLANVPSNIVFSDAINYSWFADMKNVIDLDTQSNTDNGLFMSGEADVTLTANTVATATIPIGRIVAKVKLGTITIDPEAGHDRSKFILKNVMIMKARASVQMGVPSITYTPDLFYGGMTGDKSVVKSYLSETISADDYANRYFYVFPSDNDDENTTLVTLVGTYDGQTTYFPFRINDKANSEGGATTDGTFIERNSVYVVNVTLKRLGSGSNNPEIPADPASLTVTVEPQEWETDIIQNVEW